MKKFFLATLTVIFIVCALFAVACTNNGAEYYLLTYRKANGVTYVSNVNSGKEFSNGVWEVKDGATISFTIELSDDAKGEPVVYANDEIITADNDVYSVTVTSDTEISVEGIEAAGEYNRLVFPATLGVAFNILTTNGSGEPLRNGMMVHTDTEVQFSITMAEGYYGTPQVYANETLLSATNGIYSFIMSEPTTITVEGVMKNISLTFNKGDTRVDYIGTDGLYYDVDTPLAVEYGDEIVFDVKVSVYYDITQGFEVQANTTIITPQADGHYHVKIEDNTSITVSGLEQDTGFAARRAGDGSQANPYKLSRPIDLYELSVRINDSWYMGAYSGDYYELANDIDLDGEELFVIGDGSTSYAYFSGHFDGKGHTISNYYISDTRIDQTEYSQLYLANVGLFGFIMPGANRAPVVQNLRLDNFTITANASRTAVDLDDYTLCVGALAGATFGTTVTNVYATNGRITVTGGKNSGAYVGGLIGQQFSEYSGDNSSIKFDSGVIACMTDVDISIISTNSSYVFATGGISGALIVGDEHYTSYILNCYSTGDIEGGQNAGGIVGYAYNHTAVANCYSAGDIRAITSFALSDNYLESVYHANAGGIVGYAEYSTVISNSFSTGFITAYSSRGANYQKTSGMVAAMDGSSALINADALLPALINLKGGVTNVTSDLIFDELGWNESDWQFTNGMPVLKTGDTAKSITVNFAVDSAFGNISSVTLNAYKSMAGWDKQTGSMRIPEFISGNGGYRSYGYYFDSELTEKVPRSFVITSDITLYVGFSDYAEIAGVYYLGNSLTNSITLELNENGTAVYRDGALNQTATYSWDGENIILYYSAIGILTKLELSPELTDYYFGSYYIFNGTIEGGVINIYGGAVEEIGSDGYYTGNVIYLFPNNAPLIGLKQIDGFKYGSYYFNDGEYTFFGNGTGLFVTDDEEIKFSYVIEGNSLTLTYEDGTEVEATLDDDGYVVEVGTNSVQALDEFAGTWEKSFASDKQYTFDGKGNWTYSGYDTTDSGEYTIEDGVLTDSLGAFTAKFVDGFIEITSNDIKVTYYKQGSFKGEWYYNGTTAQGRDISVGITFDGIGVSGYGSAYAEYSTGASYELTYEYIVENQTKYILIFYRDTVFGELVYNENNLTLSGTLNGHAARFAIYDGLLGLWLSDDNIITSAEFNGNGFYNLGGDLSSGALSVRGTVRINGLQRVNYTLNRSTMTGSFTYNNVEYAISFNEDDGIIEISAVGRTFLMVLPDSWYGRELKDSDGNIYTFDGKGNLPNGGKLTVSGGTVYSYKISGESVVLIDSDATITLGTDASNNSVYVLNLASGVKYLTLNTPFTGEWIMNGLGGTLIIGDIYADNTANGSYTLYNQTSKTIALTYHPDGNYLTFQYDENTVYRIIATKTGDSYQLDFGSGAYKCIPKGYGDELQGKKYSICDENGETDGRVIVFDGFGSYRYLNGAAVVLNKDGEIERSLVYGVNYYGDWIVVSNYYDYVFLACEKDTQFDEAVLYRLKDDEGNYYAIVSPDGLYEYNVKDAEDEDACYIFNGCGKVKHVSSSGDITEYFYEIVELDVTTYKHTLKFTAEDGTVLTVILDLSESEDNWNIGIKE